MSAETVSLEHGLPLGERRKPKRVSATDWYFIRRNDGRRLDRRKLGRARAARWERAVKGTMGKEGFLLDVLVDAFCNYVEEKAGAAGTASQIRTCQFVIDGQIPWPPSFKLVDVPRKAARAPAEPEPEGKKVPAKIVDIRTYLSAGAPINKKGA